MRFAFLVHPLSADSGALISYISRGSLQSSWGSDALTVCRDLQSAIRQSRKETLSQGLRAPFVMDELSNLVSRTGATAEGQLIEIPMDSLAIIQQPDDALRYIEQAAEMAVDAGARVIGLGSMTGIVGGRGTHLAERCPVAVTTGNSLTVYAAYQNLLRALNEFQFNLSQETVAVVGVPGSIASAVAGLVRPMCGRLLLVARQASAPARKLADDLQAELFLDVDSAIEEARIIISATSTGSCIDQRRLQPGSIVIDVGVPTDVRGVGPERSDVLVLTGGLVKLPLNFCTGSKVVWFQHGVIPSCLGETIVLALEGREECFSLGRTLDLDAILEIGGLAEKHGFDFTQLQSFGRPLEESQYCRFLKTSRRLRGARAGSNGKPLTPVDLAPEAASNLARHLNPVLMATGGRSGLVKTFIRGDGMYLWDQDERRYMDFVGGFGSVNLGHNPPDVVEAVQTALSQQAPGFAQSAVNPYAAALAKELAAVSPPGLEMVFFCNSGTESVEAALKLARAAVGRPGLLSCERSYHGKSMGSLSITGNPEYRKAFLPVLEGCETVPYGDLIALERALATHRFAAFVVEPMQAEGGMYPAPEGYLVAAQRLCREAGTLLILDEIQTGIGRTGKLFACEHDGVQPDVMTLAKSLGGGLMPIGAMLCRRDLWLRAYGTIQTNLLHTSTFGGGSLAAAAGLATLRTLEQQDLCRNAQARGEQLQRALARLCDQYDCLQEVRGRGLLLGLEFTRLPQPLVAHWKGIDLTGMSSFIMPNMDRMIESIPVLYTMQSLLDTYGIYTQFARSNPMVLRIQPPLIVSEEQVNQFVTAIDQTCEELDYSNDLILRMIAKTVVGQHDASGRDRESPAVTTPTH